MYDHVFSATRRVGVVVGRVVVHALIGVGLALLIAAAIIQFFWGEISVNQMLLNIVAVETDGGGGPIVWISILGIGVAPLLITVGLALWQYFRRRKVRNNGGISRPRRAPWIMRTVSTVLVAAVVIGGSAAFAATVGVRDYIEAVNSDYEVDDFYIEPTVTSDTDKRNLVLIYLESGEGTLADDELFEKDAFAPLKEVTPAAEGWQTVDDLQQYEGGGWTMSGITSTQCGIPLKGIGSSSGGGAYNALGGKVESYLDGATCLGDVLGQHGYTNVFLGGANASFAAKDIFLRSHGYSEVKDLSYWRAAGEPATAFRSDWGLSDERLLANARDEVDELHATAERTGQPFNLSLLTLDSHEPVHIYDYCEVDTQDEVTSAFFCSMTQVAGFVEHLEQQGYLKDTAVVIMGDHLKQIGGGHAFQEQLGDHRNRTIFNRIWLPGGEGNAALRPRVDQLSMYPTILEAAGLTLAGREAGLGISAFAPEAPAGSAQALEPSHYAELVTSLSPEFYAEAWSGEDAAAQ
ncbi:phosphoglycerol transferase [Arthrobacter sp. CAN_A212]|uniref:sulfatase-like hydrolase/transferase n=1 Tax=unclassified Arthrobacter TaxID=235627 RepID=UPI0018CB3801|nr:sulfatase-like hydrolase/transferase [Arthrobacter sp. CAN_C5]MBP2216463.1 phosphoglycerol transferase [Arthrobacter sp. CAN_C5]